MFFFYYFCFFSEIAKEYQDNEYQKFIIEFSKNGNNFRKEHNKLTRTSPSSFDKLSLSIEKNDENFPLLSELDHNSQQKNSGSAKIAECKLKRLQSLGDIRDADIFIEREENMMKNENDFFVENDLCSEVKE